MADGVGRDVAAMPSVTVKGISNVGRFWGETRADGSGWSVNNDNNDTLYRWYAHDAAGEPYGEGAENSFDAAHRAARAALARAGAAS